MGKGEINANPYPSDSKGFYHPNFSILEMRKLRLREVEYLAHDHTDDKWSFRAARLKPSLSEVGHLE